MAQALTGTLRGDIITLDTVDISPEAASAKSEGRRVRVVVEPLDDVDLILTPEQQARLLVNWAERGPQGPIDDGGG